VIAALGRACPGLDHEALIATAAAAPVVEVGLPRFVNEIGRCVGGDRRDRR
jgi:hypothetical protein